MLQETKQTPWQCACNHRQLQELHHCQRFLWQCLLPQVKLGNKQLTCQAKTQGSKLHGQPQAIQTSMVKVHPFVT